MRYKTWFNQPARHQRRKDARITKAKAIYPMPTEKLRPIVRCPTIRYNKNIRLGRGFTAEECKAANLDFNYARTVGVSVDLRRRNSNEESFSLNVARLREYMSKIIIYESKKDARNQAATQHIGTVMPVYNNKPVVSTITKETLDSYN